MYHQFRKRLKHRCDRCPIISFLKWASIPIKMSKNRKNILFITSIYYYLEGSKNLKAFYEQNLRFPKRRVSDCYSLFLIAFSRTGVLKQVSRVGDNKMPSWRTYKGS